MRLNILFLSLIILINVSCVSTKKEESAETLFVSVLPLKYFTEQIVGDHYPVEVMVPPGASPATYSPTPRQMEKLSNASLYLSVGHLGFEKAWLGKIRETYPAMEIVNTSIGIDLIKSEEEHHGDHMHYGIDPHVWVSPKQAHFIALNIFEAIVTIDPGNRDNYKKNLEKLLLEIINTDEKLEDKLKGVRGSKFLIFHPSLTYLARDYGLEQLSVEFEGKSPSPKQMQHIVNEARTEQIKLVLIQKEFDEDNAKSIANEIGAEIVQVNPLGYNWSEQVLHIGDILSGGQLD
jgi:zinc transport system substrate-binding protein